MFRRLSGLALALLFVVLAVPAAAAERVDRIPEIRGFAAARSESVMLINGTPFIVFKTEQATPNRAHLVLKLIVPGEPEETLEAVLYDGTLYTRENTDTQWYIEVTDIPELPTENLPVDLGDAGGLPITKIGSTPIAGTPTDQYQVWMAGTAESGIDHMALDLFIGQQINYLHQIQMRIVGNDPDLGELKIEVVNRNYDFDAANIVVGPPTNAIPREEGSSPFFNGSTLAARTSLSLAIPTVHDWAVESFGR
ncbi:MAG TPA: hypothetical protein VGE07_07630 [Herpetosiphonaceae bacterium]